MVVAPVSGLEAREGGGAGVPCGVAELVLDPEPKLTGQRSSRGEK
jgi:hypothetical protein